MRAPRVLSVCTGMGLLDRAMLDEGLEVVAGCELDPEMRTMYGHLCGGGPLVERLEELPAVVRGERFDAVIGGPPCQSHTKLRAMRAPKFPDLTGAVVDLLAAVHCRAFLFENVARLNIEDARHVRLDAMHYGTPHQSRPRWFTHSANVEPPAPTYKGTVDDLMAYSIVAGRIYGPTRGARLQGYPEAREIPVPCVVLQKGLANAVHYGLGRAWARQLLQAVVAKEVAA